jgi:hypothetical protein
MKGLRAAAPSLLFADAAAAELAVSALGVAAGAVGTQWVENPAAIDVG